MTPAASIACRTARAGGETHATALRRGFHPEAATFLCAVVAAKACRHSDRPLPTQAQLYAILDPDERNTAFFKLHLGGFANGVRPGEIDTDLLKRFPAAAGEVERARRAEDA